MPILFSLSVVGLLVANILGSVVVHSLTGLYVHRLPLTRLERDGWLLRPRRWEQGGAVYQRWFSIRHWKDHLPEAGALFAEGISKRHLSMDLDRFVIETRRAERGHWMAMTASPVFALWNPPLGVALMVGYGVVVNAPFIVVQRYNRQRAQGVLTSRARRSRR